MIKPTLAALLLLLVLAGCGQAGPLVLPDSPEAQKQDQKQQQQQKD